MSDSTTTETATSTETETEFGVDFLTRSKAKGKEHEIVSTASVFNVTRVQPAMMGHDYRQGLAAKSKDAPKPTPTKALASAMSRIDSNEIAPESHDYGVCLLQEFVIVDGEAFGLLTVEEGHERNCRVFKVKVYADTGEVVRDALGEPIGGWVTDFESLILVPVEDMEPLTTHRLNGLAFATDSKLAKENAHIKKNERAAKKLAGGTSTVRGTSRRRLSPAQLASLVG